MRLMTSPQQHRLPLVRLAVAASMMASLGAEEVLDAFPPSRDAFSSVLPVADIPQLIVLTFDDGITPYAMDLYSQSGLPSVRHRGDGCPITATFYTSITDMNGAAVPLTKCELVQALVGAGHEIATHTYSHAGNPSEEEISGAKTFLVDQCGVEAEEIRGFRAPYLQWTGDTMDRLSTSSLGFLYDSSVVERTDSDGGRNHLWPYTMDDAGPMPWAAPTDDSNGAVPGLWEVPMWSMFDVDSETGLLPAMDYVTAKEGKSAYDILSQNFERRYDIAKGGNRAPMGIFLHASWLQINGLDLRRWAEDVLAEHDDVHFVTNYQLLQWMANPVPSYEYGRAEYCADLKPECFPPLTQEGGCGYGTFDAGTCACACQSGWAGRTCMETASAVPGSTTPPTLAPNTPCGDFAQYAGGTVYAAGQRVVNRGGTTVYQCREWPNTGQCSQGGPFEPGAGHAWEEAWINVGTCVEGGGTTTTTPAETPSVTTPAETSSSSTTPAENSTWSTETPAETSSTEAPAETSSTEAPANTSSTEAPAETSSTKAPAEISFETSSNNTETPTSTSTTAEPTTSKAASIEADTTAAALSSTSETTTEAPAPTAAAEATSSSSASAPPETTSTTEAATPATTTTAAPATTSLAQEDNGDRDGGEVGKLEDAASGAPSVRGAAGTFGLAIVLKLVAALLVG